MVLQISEVFKHNFIDISEEHVFKKKQVLCLVAQSCPILCNPRDYTGQGILQARILEWVAFPFSRGSSQPRDQAQVSLPHCRWILYQLSHKGSPRMLERVTYPFSSGSSQPRNTQFKYYLDE